MKSILKLWPVLTVLLILSCTNEPTIQGEKPTAKLYNSLEQKPIEFVSQYTFKPAVQHNNLQIFIVEGKTQADNVNYITLKEAMEQGVAEVLETSTVNQLQIANSSDKVIFVHAGDMVKGGKQDRTTPNDLIVGPNTQEQPMASFCIESGRWDQRGSENVMAFSANDKMLSSRNLRMAATKHNNQGFVWNEVSNQQEQLNYSLSAYYNVDVNVQSNSSASSLELALDNEKLQNLQAEYKAAFEDLMTDKAIGLAYAINGELYNVDIYNNKQLFEDLYEKLVNAAIVEAISEWKPKKKDVPSLSMEGLQAALQIDPKGDRDRKDLNERTSWLIEEDKKTIIFTSFDKENENQWVHRNIILKDEDQTFKSSMQQNSHHPRMNFDVLPQGF